MSLRDGRHWPIGIAAVLLLTVGANAGVYWAANDSNAAAVEPDYYRKAVAWDSTLAQEARDRALGWQVDAEFGPPRSGGSRELVIRLRDAAGAPLADAAIRLTAIHNTWAATPLEGTATTDGAGAARLVLPFRHDGLWELRLDIRHGGERYAASLRREALPGDRGS
jgi:hypothetical protein